MTTDFTEQTAADAVVESFAHTPTRGCASC